MTPEEDVGLPPHPHSPYLHHPPPTQPPHETPPYFPRAQGLVPDMSGSSPRLEKLTSGYHNYPLKGLNLRYMYYSQKHFSE